MKTPKEILVSTTSTIEGLKILKYLKPVSSHVVAGTNIVSDFLASFSDVFGGRSQSYQKQLASIYNEAIEILKRKAYENEANCILGLRVDLDEISGKGKTMFMVTATGTAVIIELPSKEVKTEVTQEKLEIISGEKMTELRERKRIIELAKNENFELTESIWEFIEKHSVFEISNEVLDLTARIYSSEYTDKPKIYQHLLTYLNSVSEAHRNNLLYNFLMNQNNHNAIYLTYDLFKDLMVFDPNKLKEYLLDNNEEIKNKALQVVVVDKSFYSKDDVYVFDELINIINSNFAIKGEITTKKQMLSSKEKEIWKCTCGTKNDIDTEYCTNCNKDIYGFLTRQTNPLKAINKLKENIEIINNNVA